MLSWCDVRSVCDQLVRFVVIWCGGQCSVGEFLGQCVVIWCDKGSVCAQLVW